MVRREAAKASLPIRPSKANTLSALEPDNVYLVDGRPFRILQIAKDVITGEEWVQIKDMFQQPIPSRMVGMFKVSRARPKTLVRATVELQKAMFLINKSML